MLKVVISTLSIIAALVSFSTSVSAKPAGSCALGQACAIGGAKKSSKASVAITQADGTSYSCDVTADDAATPLSFQVRGKKVKMSTGAGEYTANPTVNVAIEVQFNGKKAIKPAKGGEIEFSKVVGGTGSVTCSPAGTGA